jgi:hypothetical protein
MPHKKLLLNRLLDKFEKSRAYLDEKSARRRVMIQLCAPEFPEYDIEKSEIRNLINSVVHDLDEQGLVGFEWMKHEEGNILHRVWLQLDSISCAYGEAGRIPKKEQANTVLSIIRECQQSVTLPWLAEFLAAAEANLEVNKSATPFLPKEVEQAKAVLRALQGINDQGPEEYLERVFSLRCFGDSKYFENNARGRVISIIRRYLVGEDTVLEAPSDDEILSQVGIVRSPEQIEFCGSMTGNLADRPVDFSVFSHGVTINSPTVADLEITGFPSVKRILFIENKANYLDYVLKNRRDDELVIFHGGFYSPVRGSFFQKVYEAGRRDRVEYHHWSDIDLGGFRIFHRLQSSIIPELMPFLMGREALLSQKQHWASFNEKYGEELEKLLGLPEYAEFHDVIGVMLVEKAKLEQEAFLL